MKSEIRYVLFDFDGTVANSIETLLRAGNEIALKHNRAPLTMEQVQMLNHLSVKERCRKLGIPLYRIPELTLEVLKNFRKHILSVPAVHGMREVLDHLKNLGLRIGILSSNSEANIRAWLNAHQWTMFDEIISSPGLFGKTCSIKALIKKHKLVVEEVIYIGDELRDIEACRRAQTSIIAVTWGLDTYELLMQGNPDFLAKEPSDIIKIIERIRAAV